MAEARSMFDRMTPPKMVPCALVSFGSRSTLMAGIRAVINTPLFFKAAREERERTKVTRQKCRILYHGFDEQYHERAHHAVSNGRHVDDDHENVERARRERAVRSVAVGQRLLRGELVRPPGSSPE